MSLQLLGSRTSRWCAAGFLAVGLAACNSGATGPVRSPTADRAFIDSLSVLHGTALLSIADLQAKGTHPELKAWALTLKDELNSELEQAVKIRTATLGSGKTPVPPAPVVIASGANYDLEWMRAMIAHEQAVLVLTQQSRKTPLQLELFTMAHVIGDEQVGHQNRLRGYAQQWYGVTL
jgi:uncharacterized protein (DUF305 family)